MKSRVVKRSVVSAGHKTSVSLEDEFWNALKEIAGARGMAVSDLIAAIDSKRTLANLSSALRVFVLGFYRDRISEHAKRAESRDKAADTTVPMAKRGSTI